MGEYWYNMRTGSVEEGPQSSWRYLLGPYPSAEAARQALAKVAERNERMDDIEDNETDQDEPVTPP